MARVRLEDIAEESGISISTVARAMSNELGVSPAIRRRVIEAADRIGAGTSPQTELRQRRRRRRSSLAQSIALVVPDLSAWETSALSSAVHERLSDAGHYVVVHPARTRATRTTILERAAYERLADAVVVLGVPVSPRAVRHIRLAGVPLLVLGAGRSTVAHVAVDSGRSIGRALEHLVEIGHRRIEVVRWAAGSARRAGSDGLTDSDRPIVLVPRVPGGDLQGLSVTFADVGFEPEERAGAGSGREVFDVLASRLLSRREPPTAVCVDSVEGSGHLVTAFRRLGANVPGDVSVVGVGSGPLAEVMDLSTVSQPIHEQADRVADLLGDLLEGHDLLRTGTVEPVVVVRGTTAPPGTPSVVPAAGAGVPGLTTWRPSGGVAEDEVGGQDQLVVGHGVVLDTVHDDADGRLRSGPQRESDRRQGGVAVHRPRKGAKPRDADVVAGPQAGSRGGSQRDRREHVAPAD